MKIEILGSGCIACKNLYREIKNIVNQIDQKIEVEYVDDVQKLIETGAMSSPVLLINGNIIMSGNTLTIEQIEEIIRKIYSGGEIDLTFSQTKKANKCRGGCCKNKQKSKNSIIDFIKNIFSKK